MAKATQNFPHDADTEISQPVAADAASRYVLWSLIFTWLLEVLNF